MRQKRNRDHIVSVPASDQTDKAWIDRELAAGEFRDLRLKERLRSLLELMANGLGQSIPVACQDWADTKAAYRFFANERVSEGEILSGHISSTQRRAKAVTEPLLVLHDTTEFSYSTTNERIGLLSSLPFPSKARHRFRGFLLHSSMALTTDGVPLGLLAAKFWTRTQFKGANALKRKVNPTRIPIHQKESFRWLENLRQATALVEHPERCVHIGDRESDIYELFALAAELGAKFLVRTCVDRLAEDGQTTVAEIMSGCAAKGLHRIELRDSDGNPEEATLEIRYEHLLVRPPQGKQADYAPMNLCVIHAREVSKPLERERIEWKLLTNLPVQSMAEAVEKLHWYALRWKIETFHKILKSGCRAEQAKLRTTERLVRLIAVYCILSWRIFWLTMAFRISPEQPAEVAFTKTETDLLDALIGCGRDAAGHQRCLGHYLMKVARLGGYLARTSDGPPGNMVMWRGLSRLTDIHLGYLLAKGDVGN